MGVRPIAQLSGGTVVSRLVAVSDGQKLRHDRVPSAAEVTEPGPAGECHIYRLTDPAGAETCEACLRVAQAR
ncbi:hypothetical protein GCM10009661_49160 [Catellatospora chokoriensis]